MADIKDLILTVVSPLVSHPDELTIDVVETEEFLEYQLSVHPDDVGRVIGKLKRK